MDIKRKLLTTLILLLIIIPLSVYARGNKEPPTISETSGPHYFNPSGGEGQNTATLEFQVKVYVKSEEGYIPKSSITIVDSSGAAVKEVKEKGKRDIGFFASLFADYKQFEQKGTLTWDGKDLDGNIVEDGTYSVTLMVAAASNQEKVVDLGGMFIVDKKDPETSVSLSETIFSPNNDDDQDTVAISQNLKDTGGSPIADWTGTVKDSANTVRKTFSGTDKSPENLVWDGKADDGKLVQDGAFTYQLSVTDKAGNSWQSSTYQVTVDARDTPVWVDIDNIYFSPNGDDVKEVATMTVGGDVTDGVKSWILSITDEAGAVQWKKSGAGTLPSEDMVFYGKDQSGGMLSDGAYTAAIAVEYDKSDKIGYSTPLYIDTESPVLKPVVSNPAFSPNGDGRQDTTEADMGVPSEEVTWTGKITDSSGKTILETSSDETTRLIVWNGKDASGKLMADGNYNIDALFRDRAGNPASFSGSIIIDTVTPVVDTSIDKTLFSPDGDGFKDTLTVSVSASESVDGRAKIIDPLGRDLYTIPFSGVVSGSVVVEAASTKEMPLADGKYKVYAEFWDAAGNYVLSDTFEVVRDTRPTTIDLSAPVAFSPNGDGIQDRIDIKLAASVRDGVKDWTADIMDATGRSVKSFPWEGKIPTSLVWDGNPGKAAEGYYYLSVKVEYEKGNRVSVTSDSIYLDVTPPTVSLTMTANPFAQTEEGIEGEAFITLFVRDNSDIQSWEVDILDKRGEVVRSYTGVGDPSDLIAWNGQAEGGKPVSEITEFILKVSVTDAAGNNRLFREPMSIDILVLKKEGKLYLMVPNIIFGAYKHALDSYSTEMYERNTATIKRVAEIYRNYPSFGVLLEGHALNIYRGDRVQEAREEKILLPLTERRAATVKQSLLKLGLEESRIETEAFGGVHPIVDVHDEEVHWKNRRVEFIMTKPE